MFACSLLRGPLCRLWVKLDTFTMSAQCRLVPQHQTYHCAALNDATGPKSDIAPVFINMSGTNVLIDNDHSQA